MSIVLDLILLAALIGAAMGGRHLYLRLDRPGGLTCSLRVVTGEVPGLTAKFRAGYAGPEMDRLMWRRIVWPDPAVRFPLDALRLDRARRPQGSDRIVVPASFSIVPVELADGVALELAVPRTGVRRIMKLRDGGGRGRRRR